MNAIICGPNISPGKLALSVLQAEGDVREVPPGSNRGPRVDAYLRACRLDPGRGKYPWCAAVVTWAIREAGLRLSLLRFRGSASVSKMLAKNATLEVPVGDAREGDVLIRIDPKGNHCGFYIRDAYRGHLRNETTREIISYEGNTDHRGGRTGGRLMCQERPAAYWTNALRVA